MANLKHKNIIMRPIIGRLFSDMTLPASNYTVPFGRIGGAVLNVARQLRLGVQKVVNVAVRVSRVVLNHDYKVNTWFKHKENKRTNRWAETDSGENERWQ